MAETEPKDQGDLPARELTVGVNHIERLWQVLYDTITRNHQCRAMWQLLKKVRHNA
ncbi:IS630 transposase [Escherichia coli]|nr:hypothetical protein A13Y_00036 [Escherichia coli KTE194]ELI19174.1 hypothetical protein WIE_04729 [Escherichia coli KTE113]EQV28778.1 hypothetical protein G881_04407 [Escherichia coli KOEGE 30 (63a)]EQX15784.1 hypothetical protein G923_03944 [Escherichia coli UMEA 3160-1]EQX72887.1 hypothetical protein G936_03936 [Escherichia coli UMEA 3193-1]ERA29945.1 hypothetical protein H002_04461 [Escherichia coli UMEA 4075-1]GDC47987.1 IS630 transposase [Escherichia coli]